MKRDNPILVQLLIAIFFCIAILAFVGCKATEPLVMVGTHDQTMDSVRIEYKRDSIFIDRVHKEIIKGDTVWIHDSIYVAVLKEILVHDSFRIEIHDSIPYKVEVQVPKKYVPKYYKNVSKGFWVLLAIVLVWVGFKAYKLYLKIQTGGLINVFKG